MTSIQTKLGQVQFWGTSLNPSPVGISVEPACCPCECWIFGDDFNRDQSTDLGANWNEVLGDWGIVVTGFEGELVEKYPY
jgi:hypothetical protein